MTKDQQPDPADQASPPTFRPTDIFHPRHRGLLLDIAVFLLNLLLIRLLMGRFVGLLKSAAAGDIVSEWVIFFFVLGIFTLPPLGATLKRWQFNLRRQDKKDLFDDGLSGCLFGPIPYFIITVVIFVVLQTFLLQYFFGDDDRNSSWMVVGTLLNLPVSIINTWLVYRYFSRPKKEPWIGFLETPQAALLGDACIFINMIFFQLVWNLLAVGWFPHPADVTEFFGRFVLILILSLLIYFPSRMFYLAEDINKHRTWIMILIANLPLIVKVMIGGSRADW